MPTYSGLQGKNNANIRKALVGSVFVGAATAGAITTLTDASSALLALPSSGGGYKDAGWFTQDGVRFARSVDTSDVTSFGAYEPTRSDVTADTGTVQIDFQETNKTTIALFTGADPAGLIPDATSGELSIAKPDRPNPRYYRILCLGVDGPSDAEIYIAEFYPRVKVTDYADRAMAQGDDAFGWGVTFTAYADATLGYSKKNYFAGVGWKAGTTAAGF